MLSYDVVIVGGGTSAIVCAYTLAKKNKKVLILEKLNSISGTQANARVTPFMPSNVQGNKYATEFRKLVLEDDSVAFNPEKYAYNVEQLLIKSGVDIYYNIENVTPFVVNGMIKNISFNFNAKTYEVKALNYIDASGDAILSRLCKLDCDSGDSDGQNQSVSLRFDLVNVNIKVLNEYLKTQNYKFCSLDNNEFCEFVHVTNHKPCGNLLDVFKQAVIDGKLSQDEVNYIQGFTCPNFDGLMTFNSPQIPKIFDFKTVEGYAKASIKGRDMQNNLAKFLKENIPGFENSFISNSANMLGIRESYRVKGEYTLSSIDYLKRQRFEDSLAKADWYVDIHTDHNEDHDFEEKYKPYEKGEYYEIPYRCTFNKNIGNLNFIGRIVSADFYAQSSIRIQYHCQDMSSSVGLILNYIIDNNLSNNNIDQGLIKDIINE